MAKLRFLLALGAFTTLTSCALYTSHEQLDALNQAVPSGSLFTQRLAVEYRDLANQNRDRFDDAVDAAKFSRKGLEAVTGKNVPPENPDDWWISNSLMDELQHSHQQLLALLDNGGRDKSPEFAAIAQARFDCWVARSDKTSSIEDQSVCRSQFEQAMAQAEMDINKPPPAAPVIPQSASGSQLGAAKFLVFFDWNQARVTRSAESVIDTAVSEAQRLGARQIDVIGNADLSGSERYNQKLSLARALAVKDKLVAHGLAAGKISTAAHGDENPLVPTDKGVREPANRRVEIHFE